MFRKIVTIAVAFWVLNPWLLILYKQDYSLYQAFRAIGSPWWNCMEYAPDKSLVPSNACTDPAPPDLDALPKPRHIR